MENIDKNPIFNRIHFSWRKLFAFVLAVTLIFILGRNGMPCLFRYFLHIPCPGCGFTRAMWALLEGKLITAWNWNPLIYVAWLFVWFIWQDGKIFRSEKANWIVCVFLVLSIIFSYVLRLCGLLTDV